LNISNTQEAEAEAAVGPEAGEPGHLVLALVTALVPAQAAQAVAVRM